MAFGSSHAPLCYSRQSLSSYFRFPSYNRLLYQFQGGHRPSLLKALKKKAFLYSFPLFPSCFSTEANTCKKLYFPFLQTFPMGRCAHRPLSSYGNKPSLLLETHFIVASDNGHGSHPIPWLLGSPLPRGSSGSLFLPPTT